MSVLDSVAMIVGYLVLITSGVLTLGALFLGAIEVLRNKTTRSPNRPVLRVVQGWVAPEGASAPATSRLTRLRGHSHPDGAA